MQPVQDAEKDKDETVYVTEIVCGLLSADGSKMETAQEKLPIVDGASTEIDRLVDPDAATNPEAAATWHQAWSVDPIQDRAVPPVLDKVTGCAGGVAPPKIPEKLRKAGLRVM